MKRLSMFMLCCALAVSCAGKIKTRINTAMSSWEGRHFTDLLASWGPPQQIMEDGSGGRVLIYLTTRSFTTQATATTQTSIQLQQWNQLIWGNATSITTYTPSRTYGYTAYRMFFISKDGIIYKWAWKGA